MLRHKSFSWVYCKERTIYSGMFECAVVQLAQVNWPMERSADTWWSFGSGPRLRITRLRSTISTDVTWALEDEIWTLAAALGMKPVMHICRAKACDFLIPDMIVPRGDMYFTVRELKLSGWDRGLQTYSLRSGHAYLPWLKRLLAISVSLTDIYLTWDPRDVLICSFLQDYVVCLVYMAKLWAWKPKSFKI